MSTSSEATSVKHPLVYASEPHIKLAIAYNPFDLTDIAKHELEYDQHKTLADYLDGLPTDAGWSVGYEGQVIEPDAWPTTKVNPFSHIVIVRTPLGGGGGGGKTVLRVVAMIAVASFAAWAAPAVLGAMAGAFGAGTAAAMGGLTTALNVVTAGLTVAGGVVVNALLPATSGVKGEAAESKSYGIDGPKNTAKEGVVTSVGYGDYRVAGNIVDMFTRNSGKDQYLFIRTTLNHGEIESIDDIEINGEPLSTFTNVQVRKRMGLETETPNDWFDEATRLVQQTIHISTDFQERTTTGEVDRLRVDVVFPSGLYSIDQDNGTTKDPREVTLELQYAPCDQLGTITGSWANFPIVAQRPVSPSGSNQLTSSGATSATLNVQTEASGVGSINYEIEGFYRLSGTSAWKSAGVQSGRAAPNAFKMATLGSVFPVIPYTFHFPTAGTYEMRVEGGSVVTDDAGFSIGTETSATSLFIRDKTTQPKRLTYEGGILERGYYKVRVRRTSPEKTVRGATVEFVYDECYITDIGEIDTTPVNLNGIANLSLCIKANEQLTGVPSVTAKCKLSKVNVYDEEGEFVEKKWSNNPADVVVDILHNQIRGAGFPLSKTVWPKYVEFREFCEAEGLEFNGVYDTVNTLWDAVQSAAKVGHGTVVPRGTKFSFAIDRAADPVALFTPTNMYQDTFKKTWLSLTDRANEVQLKFQDAEDGYKEATVRLADNAAFARGARQKIATLSGFGVTNVDQAMAEAEYAARQNSYIRSFIEFEAPLEAIGVTIGDVALIQHDSVDFNGGVGGRLKSGSTESVIHLDRPVTMTTGKQYSLLGFHSALKRYDITITNILGSRVSVSGLPNVLPSELPRVIRLKQGAKDVEIIDVRKAGSAWTLVIGDVTGLVNGSAELWDLDVIEERTVTTVAGQFETVTVTEPFSQAPDEFANFLFGEQQSVKLPYRLRSVSGNGIESRSLSWVQYDERCYEKGGWDVPAITRPTGTAVGQVRNLMAAYAATPTPTQDRIPVTLTWSAPNNTLYGGADIYLYESDRWRLVGSINDVTEFRFDSSRGEVVKFKVVAFDQNRARARFSDAPIVSASLDVFEITMIPPTNLQSELFWRTDATVRLDWTAPTNADGYYQYRVQHKSLSQAQYDAFLLVTDLEDYAEVITDSTGYTTQPLAVATQADIDKVDLGYYIARVRAEKGFNASPWIYLGVNVNAADIPIAITGLTLTGGLNGPDALDDEFTGSDANWSWDDILATVGSWTDPLTSIAQVFQDYRVEILDTEGDVVRVEYTTSPSYTYSYGKNNDDTPGAPNVQARRAFSIRVTIRGRQGQLGIPTAQEVLNQPPAIPTGVVAIADSAAMHVRWDECKEADYGGTVVWLSDEEFFVASDETRAYSGKSSAARIPISASKQYYVRVGHYDTFDDQPVNITQIYGAFVPLLAIENLEEVIEAGIDASEKVAAFEASLGNLGKSVLQLGLQSVQDRKYTDLLARLNKERLNTVVTQEITERIDGQTAIVETISLIGVVSPDGTSFDASGSTFMIDGTHSVAKKFEVIQTEFEGSISTVREEIEAATGPDSAIVTRLDAMAVQIDEDISAAITNEASLRATADAVEAGLRQALAAQVGDNLALFNTEVSARVTADNAQISTLALVGAKNGAGTAFSVNQSTFLLNGTQSTSTVLSGISSRIGSAEASISAETSARVSDVGSVASSVSNVQSQLNGMSSSISTQQSAINGLSARYGLAVSAGGYITGFVANANQSGGSFVIMANHFAIVDSGGGNQRVPFIYSGGQLLLTNTTVNGNLVVNGSITGDKILGGAVTTLLPYENSSPADLYVGDEVEHLSFTYTSAGGKHLINVYSEIGTAPSALPAGAVIRLYCNGALVGYGAVYCPASWGNAGLSFPCAHVPGAGTHDYTITYAATPGSGPSAAKRTYAVMTELKK